MHSEVISEPVRTGTWIADVTYEPAANHNSPPASPEPVTQAGWGPWEVVLGGHRSSAANTGYANPSSFQIVSVGPSPPESDYSGAHALYQDVIIV